MNKAVMISINPKWCELIANGRKTVEVRKTRPKLDTPFKCYIYCTKPKKILKYVFHETDYPQEMRPCKTAFCKVPDGSSPFCSEVNGNGKVIGEFTCNLITGLKANNGIQTYYNGIKETCLTDAEIIKYASGKMIYYWHISDLVIYDKPKKLSEFCKVDNESIKQCANRQQVGQPEYKTAHGGWIKGSYYCIVKDDWCNKCKAKQLTSPPQSWFYVEELRCQKA